MTIYSDKFHVMFMLSLLLASICLMILKKIKKNVIFILFITTINNHRVLYFKRLQIKSNQMLSYIIFVVPSLQSLQSKLSSDFLMFQSNKKILLQNFVSCYLETRLPSNKSYSITLNFQLTTFLSTKNCSFYHILCFKIVYFKSRPNGMLTKS